MSEDNDLVTLTADIVSAHVANNSVSSAEVGALISAVFGALSSLGAAPAAQATSKPQGATTARKSLSNPGHIVSMIDGKPYKMLRRHIGQHGYTPESYRETFGLPRDYPMVAKDYAEQRRVLAHQIGLGRKPGAGKTTAAGPAAARSTAAPARSAAPRGRKPKTSSAALDAAKGHLGGE